MALYGAVAENTRRNERYERGSVTFTGSTVVSVAAPLRTVLFVFAEQDEAVAPGLTPATVTVGNIGSGGGNKANQFTLFSWMPTSATAPALIAGTSPVTVQWLAIGTL